MVSKIPHHIAIFPISVVKEMTQLSARQIRYYEEQGLIRPVRNKGNQRVFSLNDIEQFLEIKRLIEQGINIAGIKALFSSKQQTNNIIPIDAAKFSLTEKELEEILLLVGAKVSSFKQQGK